MACLGWLTMPLRAVVQGVRSILIYQSGSSGVRPRERGWSRKSFQIIMNSWLEVKRLVCVAFRCF